MIVSLLILIFGASFTWLLFKFPFSKAESPKEYRTLLLFFSFLSALLIFNGLLSLSGVSGLRTASNDSILSSLQVITPLKPGDGVILSGSISSLNKPVLGSYVAYTDADHLYVNKDLLIDLSDGQIAISNNTFRGAKWPVDAMHYSYLISGHQVVVTGTIEKPISLVDGQESLSIRASMVYAGSVEDFRKRAEGNLWMAILIMSANFVIAILIVIIPIRECWKKVKPQIH